MNSSVQYAALARLLSHNNRVHDLEDMISRMQVTIGEPQVGDLLEEIQINPFADLQNEMDQEARASLVTCWLAIPDSFDD